MKQLVKRKFKPWVINSTNITSHLNWTHWTQKDHDIWCWKFMFALRQSDKCGGVKWVNGIAVDFYDCKIYIQHCLSIYNVRTMDKENKISHLLQLCAIINGFFGIILRRVKTKRWSNKYQISKKKDKQI